MKRDDNNGNGWYNDNQGGGEDEAIMFKVTATVK